MMPFFRVPLFSTLLLFSLFHQANAFWPFDQNDEESDELKLHGNVDIRQVDTAFEVSSRIAELAVEDGWLFRHRLSYSFYRRGAEVIF